MNNYSGEAMQKGEQNKHNKRAIKITI